MVVRFNELLTNWSVLTNTRASQLKKGLSCPAFIFLYPIQSPLSRLIISVCGQWMRIVHSSSYIIPCLATVMGIKDRYLDRQKIFSYIQSCGLVVLFLYYYLHTDVILTLLHFNYVDLMTIMFNVQSTYENMNLIDRWKLRLRTLLLG